MIPLSLYIKEYKGKVLQILFIFQQLKSQISQIDQNGRFAMKLLKFSFRKLFSSTEFQVLLKPSHYVSLQ